MRAGIRHRRYWILAALIALIAVAACGDRGPGGASPTTERDPATAEEKRARGAALIRQMSEKIAAAQAVTFTTSEVIERVRRRDNERITSNINREIAFRRPDRCWSKVTGDNDLEIYYEGNRATLVSHKDKVFGEIPTPPTLDETVDVLSDKYDIPMPIGDLLTTNPHESLATDDPEMTGGWAGRETVDGVACHLLTWQHPNVDWSVWVPEAGEPLPKKLQIVYKARRGQPKTTIVIRNWNLNAQLPDETFARRVPDDYEGIPVIQRASAVLPPAGQEPEPDAPAAERAVKKAKKN
jgi:hypothetical protein